MVDSMGMNGPGLVIYDDGMGDFGPMTDLRPVFEVRSGAWTTRRRIEQILGRAADATVVPDRLSHLTESARVDPAKFDQWRIVNGRCADEPSIVDSPIVSRDKLSRMLDAHEWPSQSGKTFDRPWRIISQLESNLRYDLERINLPVWSAGRGTNVAHIGEHPVRVASDAKIHPMVVFNSELGSIVVDEGAIVGSFAVLAGPCYVGKGSIVTPHSHIRSFSVLGPRCVVGGEVSYSVLQGYSNKCHSGYLGHSLVGEWVNLGADTTVSNLKNTYGPVRVSLRPDSAGEDSSLTKLGPVIGDYVRTAIGSRLLTGSCIGTGSMIAVSGFAPKCVGRFRFVTDEEDAIYDMDRFLKTARHMMGRRNQVIGSELELVFRRLGASPF